MQTDKKDLISFRHNFRVLGVLETVTWQLADSRVQSLSRPPTVKLQVAAIFDLRAMHDQKVNHEPFWRATVL